MEDTFQSDLKRLGKAACGALDADLIFFAGPIGYDENERFCHAVRENHGHKNALLMISTFGGSADFAYQMARCLLDVYCDGKITVFVHTMCKSAGTLLALAGYELVMSADSELGPLDVQLRKPDEVDERVSGLTSMQALTTMRQEAYQSFEHFFLKIRQRTRITTRTAADIAATLTVGLFSPIYGQIEPMRLGENDRAMRIGEEYGKRIAEHGDNLRSEGLRSLLNLYPSHDFVIDRTEAEKLFQRVREPSDSELGLAKLLQNMVEYTLSGEARESAIYALNFDETEDDEDIDHAEAGHLNGERATVVSSLESGSHEENGRSGEAGSEDPAG
ncbi:MAG TPA: hypothetical protein VNQ76_14220 [Planctomicrobium sp.]|nr:hypothetical protein [Planctomicrobium sp.]